MLDFVAGLLIAVGICNVSLGFVVVLGRNKSFTNIIFFCLCVAVCVWSLGLAAFILTEDAQQARVYAQIYYVAAAVIAYALLAFTLAFAANATSRYAYILLTLPTLYIVASIAAPSAGLIDSVSTVGANTVLLHDTTYNLYSFYFLSYMYSGIALSGLKLFSNATPQWRKSQLRYLLTALLLAGTLGVFFNLILPLFGNYSLIWVGPVFSIIMVILVFMAIVRLGLFDVRAAVARTVAYALLLLSLVSFYAFGLFAVGQLFFQASATSGLQYATNIILAIFLSFSFQPLKHFFDRLTDRIFYKKTYNLERAIDELNDTFVESRTIAGLIKKVKLTLDITIHPAFTHIIVTDSDGEIVHGATEAKKYDLERLFTNVPEGLNVPNPQDQTAKYLKDVDVVALARLKTSDQYVGYLLVGSKKSGDLDANDARLLQVLVDELAVALQNLLRFEEIQTFNATLQKNVDDATSKLRASNRKLKSLDASKDEFISMASHQLRTPLTSVKGYLSMVLDGDMGEITEQQRKVLEEAYASSQRMVYLIGDFLNVSRLQTGKFELEKTPAKLPGIIGEEIEQLRATAKSRGITLSYESPESFPVIVLDENKIRQVMMNFIDNAIYYSPSSTTITVSVTAHPHHVTFRVKDQGIGVPASERHQLFTKFYRASNAKKQRPDGTGIGLFMAKKVVVAHGGTIVFETTEGKGSTFGFRLPRD